MSVKNGFMFLLILFEFSFNQCIFGKYDQPLVFLMQVACWSSHIGVPSCLKWAPRRAMFAAASSVLTFWIPNNDSKPKAEYGGTDAEAGAQPQPFLH